MTEKTLDDLVGILLFLFGLSLLFLAYYIYKKEIYIEALQNSIYECNKVERIIKI